MSREGFSPEDRKGAWWSTDSRRAYSGKAFEVVAEKLGKLERPDLSGFEHVQMGLRMEATIGRFAEEELGFQCKALGDAVAIHPKHEWLRSHGDFLSADRTALVECKNYNALHINYYSEPGDPVRVPDADWAQCCHEAACWGVDTVYLAVLFGGQRFRTYRLDFTPDDKDALIQRMAKLWASVQTGTLPEPESPTQARIAYPIGGPGVAVANSEVEHAAKRLAGVKASIKAFEQEEEKLAGMLQRIMGEASELQSADGRTLATWKNSKPTKRFSASLFRQAMPDIYEQFVIESPGDRRFLLKEKAE